VVAGNSHSGHVSGRNATGTREGIREDAEVGLIRQQDSQVSQVVAGGSGHNRVA
jgi:hypothetical protein